MDVIQEIHNSLSIVKMSRRVLIIFHKSFFVARSLSYSGFAAANDSSSLSALFSEIVKVNFFFLLFLIFKAHV